MRKSFWFVILLANYIVILLVILLANDVCYYVAVAMGSGCRDIGIALFIRFYIRVRFAVCSEFSSFCGCTA